jgi:hypothetical protein
MQGVKECLNKEHATALKKYAYDQQFWERQIKASKGFEWSKKMLNQMMSWASKFNEDDEVVECALNKVDLYHKEQNDAPRIVQLVADGDIETALERIEKFGGDDKEGLQRKFILYMLCLMEILYKNHTLSVQIKDRVERILKGIEKSFPTKVRYFNANRNDFSPETNTLFDAKLFFPDIIFLDVIWVLSKYQFDISVFKNVTSDIDFSWIEDGSDIKFPSEKERKYLINQKKRVSKLLKEKFNQIYPSLIKKSIPKKSTNLSLKELEKIDSTIRIEELEKLIYHSNFQVNNNMEKLFFDTLYQLGDRQNFFINLLSMYLSIFPNEVIENKLKRIRYNPYTSNRQKYSSAFMEMKLYKLIIIRKWVENRSEAKDLIYSMLENNKTFLFQFSESLMIQNLSFNEILQYLNNNYDWDESDYFAMGKCIAECVEMADLSALLNHNIIQKVKSIVLLGFVLNYKKISSRDLLTLLFLSKDFPSVLKIILEKENRLNIIFVK